LAWLILVFYSKSQFRLKRKSSSRDASDSAVFFVRCLLSTFTIVTFPYCALSRLALSVHHSALLHSPFAFCDIARNTLPTLALSSLSAVSSHALTLGWNAHIENMFSIYSRLDLNQHRMLLSSDSDTNELSASLGTALSYMSSRILSSLCSSPPLSIDAISSALFGGPLQNRRNVLNSTCDHARQTSNFDVESSSSTIYADWKPARGSSVVISNSHHSGNNVLKIYFQNISGLRTKSQSVFMNTYLFIYLYSGFGTIANYHQPLILAIATGP